MQEVSRIKNATIGLYDISEFVMFCFVLKTLQNIWRRISCSVEIYIVYPPGTEGLVTPIISAHQTPKLFCFFEALWNSCIINNRLFFNPNSKVENITTVLDAIAGDMAGLVKADWQSKAATLTEELDQCRDTPPDILPYLTTSQWPHRGNQGNNNI